MTLPAGSPSTSQVEARADVSLTRAFDLVQRLEPRGPRYTSYPTVPVWSGLAPEAHAEAVAALKRRRAPIAVYLHLPFCAKRCFYCGCNSFISQDGARMERYVDALAQEARDFGGGLTHRHLHLGGGTPTHLPPDLLARVLDAVIETIPGADGPVEHSVEVDPRVTTDEHLDLLAERGFRRISVGVQDLDHTVQQTINRVQPYGMVRDFVERARAHGFESVNIDIIYGLPQQTLDTWRATLLQVLTLEPDRLACFGYAHLPTRIKHQRVLPMHTAPSSDRRLQMLVEANAFFVESGYDAIGFDHFARPDDELAKASRQGHLYRNFMGYTTTRGLEMVGFGCSAISRLDGAFWQNEVHPTRYAERVEAGQNVVTRGHVLDADDRYRKSLITDLMCNLSIRPEVVANETGIAPPDLSEALEAMAPFVEEGLLTATDGGYRVTPEGQLFLRNLAMPFDRYLRDQKDLQFSRTV